MPKKAELFMEQHDIIVSKIFEIMGITKDKNYFYLIDLDNNEETRKKIDELIPDVKKYYTYASWTCFSKPEVKRRQLSMIKFILKNSGYKCSSGKDGYSKDGKIIWRTICFINKV